MTEEDRREVAYMIGEALSKYQQQACDLLSARVAYLTKLDRSDRVKWDGSQPDSHEEQIEALESIVAQIREIDPYEIYKQR